MGQNDSHNSRGLPRRSLLKVAAAGAMAGPWAFGQAHDMKDRAARPGQGTVGPGATRSAAAAPSAGGSAEAAPAPPVYTLLNVQEVAFLEAAVDTLIPADECGPGALEVGAVLFMDRQLGGEFGRGDRLYLQGPFAEGTPEQGYQLRMTPAELVQAGIADVNAYAQRAYQSRFEALPAATRVTVLAGLEQHNIELPTVPAGPFFEVLLELTQQGFFCDPIYGGNRGKASWKMLGFPGIGGMYADKIAEYRNRPYSTEPVGIEDLL
jgi:gluconate 2-dehydrogenase gamma chain